MVTILTVDTLYCKDWLQALKFFLDQKLHIGFKMQWVGKLLRYDLKIEHEKGRENKAVDAMSRSPMTEGLLQLLQIHQTTCASISMDFIDGLSKSQGKTTILVVVDRLTKYVHFMLLTYT